MKHALLAILLLGACQHDVVTPFPPGLEPLEDNPVPEASAPYAEALQTQTRDDDYIRVYGRGYVLVPPAALWPLTMTPEADIAACNTDEQLVTPNNDPAYAYSFLVHYVVHEVLTVEWDDQWRFGVIEGTDDAPTFAMIEHQKIEGSSFISRSEGTIELLATDDPGVTELAFVEHLDAISGSTSDVQVGMQHKFDAFVALAHGNPIPPCP